MSVQSFATEIERIVIRKFASLSSPTSIPDLKNSIDILPQAQEISIFESIFEPVLRCEIAVVDYIGLFNNFPLMGEEVIEISYKNSADKIERSWMFAIEEVRDIAPKDDSRALSFVISGISIEGLANNLGTVQKGYRGTPVKIAHEIFQENIVDRIKQFYPGYRSPNIFLEDNETEQYAVIVPNMHPIAAIDMVNELAFSRKETNYTYLFYQSINNAFNFVTLQGLIDRPNARRFAKKNEYTYLSDEITDDSSKLNNNVRVITKLAFNKRLSSLEKVAAGYFNNKLFEINIAQKAVHSTKNFIDDPENIVKLDNFELNTTAYKNWAKSFYDEDEKSNRTKYVVTTRAEHNEDYIVNQARTRWGKDLSAVIALNQIDLTVVIPGTNRFKAGDLFYLTIPQFHGFEDLKDDDYVSGMYIITEIKQIISMGGYQTTVLRINKDSYRSDPNRGSKYK